MEGEEEEEEITKERALKRYREIISRLPKVEGWWEYTHEYQGVYFNFQPFIEGIMWVQERFKPRKQDVVLVTLPKSGTTWFKSLLFSVMNRSRYHDFASTHPLLTSNPHDLVPFLELYLHQDIPFPNDPDDDDAAPPRLFQTHIPFTLFSASMMESQCRIVYACRNPKDVFVSLFCFRQKIRRRQNLPPCSIEKAFEKYCDGVSPGGPFWNHVLGYWKASLEWPERVMFVKYEDMKKKDQATSLLKRLAEFMGCPFSEQEERGGTVMNQILELCSFQKLSNLEVNKTGQLIVSDVTIKNDTFFRKGEVGDWKRHLTAEMGNRLDKIIEEKFAASGLTFIDSDHA